MFTQITIIKTNDTFKITFFNQDGVAYSERINEIAEVMACMRPVLEQMIEDPRSTYAKS